MPRRAAIASAELPLRTAMAEACRRLAAEGLVRGTSGNIGVRHGDGLLVTPTGMAYEAMGPEHIVRLAWDGSWTGSVAPTSEWRFHRDILRERPDLGAVVHTHSPHATAVSILGRDLPAVHYMIAAAGGPTIRCAPYATFGTAELAANAVRALAGRRACLLAHHGVIAAGAALAEAMTLAATVEEIAQSYLLCLPAGEPPVLPDDEMERVAARFATYGQQPRAGRALAVRPDPAQNRRARPPVG